MQIVKLGDASVLVGQVGRELYLGLYRVRLHDGEELDSIQKTAPGTLRCRLLSAQHKRLVCFTPDRPYEERIRIRTVDLQMQVRPGARRSLRRLAPLGNLAGVFWMRNAGAFRAC